MDIPKIIHQTAPTNKSEWHPIWEECQKSWKKNFSDFEYIMWDDENIRNLIKNNYPQFLNEYDSWEYHIMRVDFARLCILHSYGGIYADMDIFCYQNFYNLLNNHQVYIVESWEEWKEKIQNSLMASIPKHKFWINCCEKLIEQINKTLRDNNYNNKTSFVLNTTGPQYMSNLITSDIGILPKELFNPMVKVQFNWAGKNYNSDEYKMLVNYFHQKNMNSQSVITRHYLTGIWSLND